MFFKSLHWIVQLVHLSGCVGQEELAGPENSVVLLWLAVVVT